MWPSVVFCEALIGFQQCCVAWIGEKQLLYIRRHTLLMLSEFGGTYRCEQVLSNVIRNVKSRTVTRLTEENLKG
jgi:hypothetical protein